ncbi:hypothetical protein Lac3_17130 [Claveliimonas bilis]|nr:hypothetical protein Lac3_17130 [Claveliimonas bilis]
MKNKLIDIYRNAIVTTSILIATIIVLFTSPLWAFIYLSFNSTEIIESVEDWMKNK